MGTASAIALVVAVTIGAGWWIANAIDPRLDATDIAGLRENTARIAGQRFLNDYVEPDGRVVRRDEGGDVVSEGQAYGMLIAVAVGDENRFRSIWNWTKTHLRRADGLLAWRWADTKITDVNSAADADLDAARSLLLAGRRFQAPQFTEDGRRLGVAIVETETVAVGTGTAPSSDVNPPGTWVAGSGRTLVGGNWATTPPYLVNPGYFSPRAERELFQASSDRRWIDIKRTQRILAWQLIGTGMLPPDWTTVTHVGHAVPAAPPSGGQIRFGLDAARLPVRFAESCDHEDRVVAGAMRPILTAHGDVPALRNLDGSPDGTWQHPVALVATAATEQGAGDADGAVKRLDAAAQMQQRSPTYYGAAWVALGRIMLTTSLLGDCSGPG
ncbi:glycosyl hydrolase family 8 [Mycobacterium sp. NPDC048908]|uniref:glycosyl hydrolase family 8 n=1 Tax=Mycobacterium sp. NPDC048908 TaxID=3364292 RepID=UPI00370FE716